MSWIFIPLVIILGIFWYLSTSTIDKTEYYEILNYFDEGKVTEYSLNLGSGKLTYVLDGEKEKRIYTVPNATLFINDVHEKVREYNIGHADKPIKMDYVEGASSSVWMSVLPTIFMMALVVAALVFVTKKMNQTMSSENNRTINFSKARIKAGVDEKRKTTFADVAGVDEEKEELSEIVEFLRAPKKFSDLGARIPKGVLLVGPPGTGKTLLARAVAGEAGVPFLSISGSDFVEMYVGVGASRVRDLFEGAKKNAPAIIFIDEIDAVGRHRGAGMGGGHDEREQTLNQLLVEMDGFGTNEGVIIIAATNRPDILDPALLRPGRFDRQVTVSYPDIKGRGEILKVHAKDKPLAPDVELDKIARSTAGFTGADLENLLNEAALLAARRGLHAITMSEIDEATIKVVVGTEKKSRKISDKEKKLTAYHEAGHALTNFYIEGLDPVHQISIIPRGMAGGYTMSIPTEDKSYTAKSDMLNEVITLLGGRVAESVVLGDISTGASNDIERATEIARKMITKYGMSDILGPISYGSNNQEVFLGKDYNHVRNYSENTAAEIDNEISKIITNAYDRAEDIMRSNLDKLHRLAKYLIEYEKLDGEMFKKLMTTDEDYDFSEKEDENSDDNNSDLENTDANEGTSSETSSEISEETSTDLSEVENTHRPFDVTLECTDTVQNIEEVSQERKNDLKHNNITKSETSKKKTPRIKNLEETAFFDDIIDEKEVIEIAEKKISDKDFTNTDDIVYDLELSGNESGQIPEKLKQANLDMAQDLEEEKSQESVEISETEESTYDSQDLTADKKNDDYKNPYLDVADELKELSIGAFFASSVGYGERKLATDGQSEDTDDVVDADKSNASSDVEIENMIDALSNYSTDSDGNIELSENDEIYELYELLKATRDFSPNPSSSTDEKESDDANDKKE
ncbi:MAG: ATP-dependent zinc metalloprotease FtsH [Clostridia bacterium]|nr:ATP-dependent zinc metalloprotease FtsH [Clostridia bacterium]